MKLGKANAKSRGDFCYTSIVKPTLRPMYFIDLNFLQMNGAVFFSKRILSLLKKSECILASNNFGD